MEVVGKYALEKREEGLCFSSGTAYREGHSSNIRAKSVRRPSSLRRTHHSSADDESVPSPCHLLTALRT